MKVPVPRQQVSCKATLGGSCFYLPGARGDTVVKNPLDNVGNARDVGSIQGVGRSPKAETGNPLQGSCLENSMDREAWWVAVYDEVKSWTQHSTIAHK